MLIGEQLPRICWFKVVSSIQTDQYNYLYYVP
jgi:hypothetical protein